MTSSFGDYSVIWHYVIDFNAFTIEVKFRFQSPTKTPDKFTYTKHLRKRRKVWFSMGNIERTKDKHIC